MRKICAKFVSRVLREDQKERRCHDSKEMVELINSDPAVLDALVTSDESWINCYDPETKRQNSQWKHAPRPKKARQSKSTHKLLMIPFFDSTGMIYMHWVPTGQTVNKEYYVEVLREFRKRFRRKSRALLKSGQWHFHQDNTLVHNSILVTDYLTKMGIKAVPHAPYSPDVVLVTFAYSLGSRKNLEAVVIEEMKEAMTKVIDTLTQGLPWGLPEVVGTVQQVHCNWRRLLRRGLEFHACTINKSALTKMSRNLSYAPHINNLFKVIYLHSV